MGDHADGHACDKVITAFAADIIRMFRSELLDLHFEGVIEYYVEADDNWEVHLYAEVKEGAGPKHTFRIEAAPTLYPRSDSVAAEIASALHLSEEEVEKRLIAAGESLEELSEEEGHDVLCASLREGEDQDDCDCLVAADPED